MQSNNSALLYVRAGRRTGNKQLSKPMIGYRRIYVALGFDSLKLISYYHTTSEGGKTLTPATDQIN